MSRVMSNLSNIPSGACGWCAASNIPVVYVPEYEDDAGDRGVWFCATCLFARTLAGAQITTGQATCENDDDVATHCTDCSTNRCDDCGSGEEVYCYAHAETNWELHGDDNCDHSYCHDDCSTPNCDTCGEYPEVMKCDTHNTAECSECGKSFHMGEVRCTSCHEDYRVPGVVMSEDGLSYQIDGVAVEWG